MENKTINVTIHLKLLFLKGIRSSYTTDMLILCVIVPMGILGTIFNTICLIIFMKKSFKKIGLFKYLIVYTASCIIVAFSQIFFFYFSAYQFYDLAMTYFGRIFKCYIAASSVTPFFFFYGNVIDVLINFERAINFSYKLQRIKQISPYKICFVAFIVCLFINIPNNLAQEVVPTEELYIKLRYCYETSFSVKPIGRILLYLSFIIEGPVLLILVIVSNILSIVSFKSFVRRKAATQINDIQNLSRLNLKKKKKMEKLDKNLLWMTFYLTLFSFIILVIQFIAQLIIFIFINFFDRPTSGWLIFLFIFIMAVKQFSNIFFYFHFNRNFRKTILSYLYN